MKTIELGNNKQVIVDDDWFPILNQWKWYCSSKEDNKGYAVRDIGTREQGQSIFLHRYIMMAPDCYQVDHVNQNKLDCQRTNLRLVKPEKNYINRKMLSTNTTGFKGVCFDKARGKFTAHIALDKKQHNLGRFDTAIEAARVYNEAAKKLHGEYAFLNVIPE